MKAGPLQEVELKLVLSAEAADTAEAIGLFSGPPAVIHQQAVYFDTPDHRLARAGISLRIRRAGGEQVQTIKLAAGGASGLFVRQEWECANAGDRPILDQPTPIVALLGNKVAAIVPLFTITNERRVWQREGIEIVLDRGCIIAGQRQTALVEVELEQKTASCAALFALARHIAEEAPVQLGVLSKAQQGYRLLGPAPIAFKEEAIDLSRGMTAGEAFGQIAQACIVQFRLNEMLVIDQQYPEALHQARVALRRLRSAFSIHKTMLSDRKVSIFNDELRWLAGELGKARDLDVLIDRTADRSLRLRLIGARSKAYAEVVQVLASYRSRILLIGIAEWLELGEWRSRPGGNDARDGPVAQAAEKALQRYHRRIKTGGRKLHKLDDAARHELRKSVKKLRYAADFFAALFDHKRQRRHHKLYVLALENLQDQLGALNDLATAPLMLARLGLADHPQATPTLNPEENPRLVAAAVASYDDLMAAKRFWR